MPKCEPEKLFKEINHFAFKTKEAKKQGLVIPGACEDYSISKKWVRNSVFAPVRFVGSRDVGSRSFPIESSGWPSVNDWKSVGGGMEKGLLR